MNAPLDTHLDSPAHDAHAVTGDVPGLMAGLGLKAKVASALMARAPAAIKNRAISQGKFLFMLELQRRCCDDGRQNAYCKA